jgi:hypothetical protein
MQHRGRLIHGVGSDRLPAICENSPQEEPRGFEPLTPCMPYTDVRAYDDGLLLSTCHYRCPLGTVIDRC